MMEDLMTPGEARNAADNLVSSGLLRLYANYHQAHYQRPKIVRVPMNNEHDYQLGQHLFQGLKVPVYAASGVKTGWFFRLDLDEASPCIAREEDPR